MRLFFFKVSLGGLVFRQAEDLWPGGDTKSSMPLTRGDRWLVCMCDALHAVEHNTHGPVTSDKRVAGKIWIIYLRGRLFSTSQHNLLFLDSPIQINVQLFWSQISSDPSLVEVSQFDLWKFLAPPAFTTFKDVSSTHFPVGTHLVA